MSAQQFIKDMKKFDKWLGQYANQLLEITDLNLDLTLTDIRMNSLPCEIWAFLPNLQSLKVTNKGITSLPEEIGISCPKITTIFLSSNWLMSLPDSFSKLEKLETLDLAGNWLKKLPNCIFELKELLDLDISANRISSLPEDMSKLENLERLNISWNLIDSLDSITNLKNLKILNASQNSISSIRNCKPDILEMKNLESLNLKGNAFWIKVPDKFWTSNLANNTVGIRKHVDYLDFSKTTFHKFLIIFLISLKVMEIFVRLCADE